MAGRTLSAMVIATIVGVAVIVWIGYFTILNKPPAGGPTAMPAPATSVTPPVNAYSDLQNFSVASGNVTAKVQYTFSSTAGNGQEGEMTQYWLAGADKWRMDSTFGGATTTTIHDDGTTYTCTEQSQACLSMATAPTSGAAGTGTMTSPSDATADAQKVDSSAEITRSSRTVAGRAATCFDVSAADGTASSFCFDDALKIVLSWQVTAADGSVSKMQATEVSTDVTAADFTPPYPVRDINAMLHGMIPEGTAVPGGAPPENAPAQ